MKMLSISVSLFIVIRVGVSIKGIKPNDELIIINFLASCSKVFFHKVYVKVTCNI